MSGCGGSWASRMSSVSASPARPPSRSAAAHHPCRPGRSLSNRADSTIESTARLASEASTRTCSSRSRRRRLSETVWKNAVFCSNTLRGKNQNPHLYCRRLIIGLRDHGCDQAGCPRLAVLGSSAKGITCFTTSSFELLARFWPSDPAERRRRSHGSHPPSSFNFTIVCQ